MIAGARMWFAALPLGWKWAAGGAATAVLLGTAAAVWLMMHDAKVIEKHEEKRKAAAAPALEKAAEERVTDAFVNQRLRDERDAAIQRAEAVEAAKPPQARATVAPQSRALNCERLRQAEMTADPIYKEWCL